MPPQLSIAQHRHQHNISGKLRSSSLLCFQPSILFSIPPTRLCSAMPWGTKAPITNDIMPSYSQLGHVKGQDLSAYRCGKEIGGKCDVCGCGCRVDWDTCCDSDVRGSSRGCIYVWEEGVEVLSIFITTQLVAGQIHFYIVKITDSHSTSGLASGIWTH